MGTLSRFRFSDELLKRYPVLIETGTWRGAGMRFAREYDFRSLYTIDVNQEATERARTALDHDPRISFVTADSRDGLNQILDELGENPPGIVFWLDAHFG